MVKYFVISILTCLLCLCSCSKRTIAYEGRTTYNKLYKVKKIKEVNDWYFIYFQRNDSVFKVVSKKPSDTKIFEKRPMIKKRGRYSLELISFEDLAPVWDGVKVWIPGFTGCFGLDSITDVCMEPNNDIWMIYVSPNLDGLFLKYDAE